MRDILFTIGPLSIHSYGLMIGLGVLAAYLVADRRAKNRNMDRDGLLSMILFVLLGGLLGAKLLYWLTQLEQIIKNPAILLNIADGFVIYGGIIGGVLTATLYCRKKKLPFLQYADLLIPSVALAQGFGRIGCFLAGCCYGAQTTCPINIVFPMGSQAPGGVPLIPTQLISSALDFLLFFALILYAKRAKTDGQVTVLYMLLYSIGRFVLEFFRGDLERGFIGALTTSQFISIFIFALSCAAFFILKNKKRKERIAP